MFVMCRFKVVIKLKIALSLRSAPENLLLGKPQSVLSTARLTCGVDILCVVQFYCAQQTNALPESYEVACETVNAT